jgi:hypothetical protein
MNQWHPMPVPKQQSASPVRLNVGRDLSPCRHIYAIAEIKSGSGAGGGCHDETSIVDFRFAVTDWIVPIHGSKVALRLYSA